MPKKVANPNNKTLSFSVDATRVAQYTAQAKLQGLTLSTFLRMAVDAYVRTYNKPKEN